MRHGYLLSTLLLVAASAHAGVIINGTRLVYQGDKKESSLGLSNPDTTDYLVQSWVDSGSKNPAKAPFLITPPLFRLDAKEDNVLRVVRTGGNLPEDRESLYWLNIKAIPSSKHVEGMNTLQIAINTRIKLLYHPSAVKGKPDDVADQLEWRREGNDLVVNNPTPFYMNFQTVTLNGQKVTKATWAVPKTETHFALPGNVGGSTVAYSIINDYGSVSHTWSKSVH
ncbi:molecular chaperone [Enterobacter hormaechei]|uniref:Molecular chaperone n=2 Tax=Enterobacteriaceae TaxID=543 RepID=A0ABD4JSN3_9ENTR|nr:MULTISPECIES: molecular chaperone [Enterobacter cloacae complex]AJB70334.1 long polar fimbrial chaperone LpfB [Enterobacter hormaechei subsp. hormaechei]EGQ5309172.1 molecular chaperone [Enterobacter hormaechei]EGQ5314827.1 molecular chaperone [Enterobacter hormaechei]EGQ5324598.1 molecular chaperone [Enterobacter hormaechei]EJB6973014.1 molecular chaperone [Enterobacter hormaechei]